MFAVESDKSKSLVVISVAGRVTGAELKAAATQLREVVREFAPGFGALTDFRFLEVMEAAAAPHVANIMDALAERQVALVVRVMPDARKDIGLNIMSQFHYGPEIRIVTVETLADAFEILTTAEA